MCPNQEVERSLLPDCHISNRVFMYSMLDYLHAGERRSEEVDAQLRDRYEVFCQVLDNFPIPLHSEPDGECDYECVLDALYERLQQREHERERLHPELSMSSSVSSSTTSFYQPVTDSADTEKTASWVQGIYVFRPSFLFLSSKSAINVVKRNESKSPTLSKREKEHKLA